MRVEKALRRCLVARRVEGATGGDVPIWSRRPIGGSTRLRRSAQGRRVRSETRSTPIWSVVVEATSANITSKSRPKPSRESLHHGARFQPALQPQLVGDQLAEAAPAEGVGPAVGVVVAEDETGAAEAVAVVVVALVASRRELPPKKTKVSTTKKRSLRKTSTMMARSSGKMMVTMCVRSTQEMMTRSTSLHGAPAACVKCWGSTSTRS